jgi:hypothetical protein
MRYLSLNIIITIANLCLIIILIFLSKDWFLTSQSAKGIAEIIIFFNQLIVSHYVIIIASIINKSNKIYKNIFIFIYLVFVNFYLIEFRSYFTLTVVVIFAYILFLIIKLKINFSSKRMFIYNILYLILILLWYIFAKEL